MKVIFEETKVQRPWQMRFWNEHNSYDDYRKPEADDRVWDVTSKVIAHYDAKTSVLVIDGSLTVRWYGIEYDDAAWRPEPARWLLTVADKAEALRVAIHHADTWHAVVEASIPAPDERSNEQVKADYFGMVSTEQPA